LVTLADYI